MKLYLISQTERNGWDTYDSAVVAAESEEEARYIQPHSRGVLVLDTKFDPIDDCWASKPENVTVKYLGDAAEGIKKSVICASFNEG